MDYSLKSYRLFLESLEKKTVYTVETFLQSKPTKNVIILRHDVDRLPNNALRMAKLESSYNIKSTYYFRYHSCCYNPSIIKQISDLGHEIGYHYETVSKCKGDLHKSVSLFIDELQGMRSIVNVSTVSMHGRPLSNFDNYKIWEFLEYEDMQLLGDASKSINNIIYLTDSGRTWNNANNLRDKINDNLIDVEINSTEDMIIYVSDISDPIYINVHPERWNDNLVIYILYYLFDLTSLIIKNIIKQRARTNNVF